jgi:hypothetical protein
VGLPLLRFTHHFSPHGSVQLKLLSENWGPLLFANRTIPEVQESS